MLFAVWTLCKICVACNYFDVTLLHYCLLCMLHCAQFVGTRVHPGAPAELIADEELFIYYGRIQIHQYITYFLKIIYICIIYSNLAIWKLNLWIRQCLNYIESLLQKSVA